MKKTAPYFGLFSLFFFGIWAQGAIIWSGPEITFTKAVGVDPTLSVNQDRLTAAVWLTRQPAQGILTGGLINIHEESIFSRGTSPLDTAWAFTGIGNPTDAALVTAANYSALTFSDLTTALAERVGAFVVGRKGVLHLISEDIYIDITFDSWSQGNDGFSYTRSSVAPVPEPAGYGLAAALLCLLATLSKCFATPTVE